MTNDRDSAGKPGERDGGAVAWRFRLVEDGPDEWTLSDSNRLDFDNPAKWIVEPLYTSAQIDRLQSDLDRAFAMLSNMGVPKERAKTVANGLMVLESRLRKQEQADQQELASLRAANEALRKNDARYRWLRARMKKVSETRVWEEEISARGKQRTLESRTQVFHYFEFDDQGDLYATLIPGAEWTLDAAIDDARRPRSNQQGE